MFSKKSVLSQARPIYSFLYALVALLVLFSSPTSAQEAPSDSHPAAGDSRKTTSFANDNAETDDLSSRTQEAEENLEAAQARLEELKEDFERTKQKVEQFGLTSATGYLLKKKKSELSELYGLESEVSLRESTLSDLQLERLKVEESLRDLSNSGAEYSVADRARLDTRLELLNTYVNALIDLDSTQREIIEIVERYRDFINEHILWVRSSAPLATSDIEELTEAAIWLIDLGEWSELLRSLARDISSHPLNFGIAVIVILGIWPLAIFARRRLLRLSQVIERHEYAPIHYTLRVLGMTLIAASPAALTLLVAAWRMHEAPGAPQLSRALSVGMGYAVAPLFFLQALRLISLPKGLGDIHFGWKKQTLVSFRRNLFWLRYAMIPSSALAAALFIHQDVSHSDSLGRFAFITALLSVGFFCYRCFSPSAPIIKAYTSKRKRSWFNRMKTPLFVALLLGPLLNALFTGLGYYYSAREIYDTVLLTAYLLAGVIVFSAIIQRGIRVNIHRMTERERKKNEKKKAEEAEQNKSDPTEATASLENPEIDEIDVDALRDQAAALRRGFFTLAFFVGLFFIWRNVLPAIGFLDDIEFWSYTLESGDTVSVTLQNVLLAIVAIILTVVVLKSVPGFLHTAILHRTKIDSGAQFAIVALSRYAVAVVGLVLILNALEISWGALQWMAAGLSVGLGFGLQEIFANFMSGIIILFERPMRVGDTVTVGTVTGRVTQINMRATTIRDWDEKELVVPNKSFIVDQIINWSLSSEVLRVVVKVGIAYGSDTKKAEETLLRVASESRKVLETPKPFVMFNEFGDSTLNFELRVFVTGINDYRFVRHELHRDIDAAFRDADIEIAFPQRVVHLQSQQDEANPKERSESRVDTLREDQKS